jgi:hypothetical protein
VNIKRLVSQPLKAAPKPAESSIYLTRTLLKKDINTYIISISIILY